MSVVAVPAVVSRELGLRYGRFWALRGCTLELPVGSVTAIVGPNGAGKTTLLNMLVGLLAASEGDLEVFGSAPANSAEFLGRVGFVAQDCPLYREFSVTDLMRMGRHLNPRWDDDAARDWLSAANVPLDRRAGKLSGGQRAQAALALAIAKRPELLVLDEPLASLDPLARREFVQSLMRFAATSGVTVVLSSHLVGDLARVCDQMAIVANGRLRLSGELDVILEEHRWVAGSAPDVQRLPDVVEVIATAHHERHDRALVRTSVPLLNPALVVSPVDLEDLVLAYLERSRDDERANRSRRVAR